MRASDGRDFTIGPGWSGGQDAGESGQLGGGCPICKGRDVCQGGGRARQAVPIGRSSF